MNQSDTLYRAFIDYIRQVDDCQECANERKAIATSSIDSDLIEVISTSCLIDEDWIIAIEKGLIFIEKAIGESRQFIRTEGSVLPIEKVKRISRDSIIHLAQHSELMTKEASNLIPDELYISERLSDFAIYENKFLCLLLNQLKSFVAIRYNKILELTNQYSGSLILNKTIATNKRKTIYELKMSDIRCDDPYLKDRGGTEPLIKRIDDIQRMVTYLMNTDLIQEVSKNPPLRPPIIKTNILKMNRNFKEASILYDFITAYESDGYKIVKNHERISPFCDSTANEIAQTIMLTSFLVYKSGLRLEDKLKDSYEREEKRRKIESEKKQKSELMLLKRRISEIEANNLGLVSQISQLNEEHKQNIEKLNENNKTQIELINQKHREQTEELSIKHEKEIKDLNNLLDEQKIKSAELEKISSECCKIIEEKKLLEAKLMSLKIQFNLIDKEEDFTHRDSFEQLERQFKSFKSFFKNEWKKTKKRIRREILSQSNSDSGNSEINPTKTEGEE